MGENNGSAARSRGTQQSLRSISKMMRAQLNKADISEFTAVWQAEVKRLDSARRDAEAAAAQAAAEARAAPRQLFRGPNFGKMPRQPSLPLGSQDPRQDGSQRPSQGAAAAAAEAERPPEVQVDLLGGRGAAGSRGGTPRADLAAASLGAVSNGDVVVLGSDDDDIDALPGTLPCKQETWQQS